MPVEKDIDDLRIFWIPQVPMKPFYVYVKSVREGVFIMYTLAEYDLFQLENKIKPDYCNTGGLEMKEGDEWVDWYDDETNEDDPELWLREHGSDCEEIENAC